ncbi:c-type cytochrome [Jannaschia donghaensis]|uniref:Cytochrome c n=1 Tax=Jannaschia donghaensis TaxID=420998 RepID=A0A0M6YL44_9RHOB|nr:cytochrome c [Jannaschia donghaensis]CTQ50614.1 Cytochrome c' precursor [Jannaschia donghaensis]
MHRPLTILALVGAFAATSVAFAEEHAQTPREVKARQGLMNVISLNLAVVGDMAKGETEYDAEAAEMAADSLMGVALVDQTGLWPDATLGTQSNRALGKIGEDRAGFLAIWDDFDAAAASLQAVAADGPEGLGAALGELGKTCKACHDDYRVSR